MAAARRSGSGTAADPLAVLAERVAEALLEYAATVRTAPASSASPAPAPELSELSPREQAALALPELAGEHGLSSGELAKLGGWKQPNADALLKRLERKQLVVPLGGRPARWRLTPR